MISVTYEFLSLSDQLVRVKSNAEGMSIEFEEADGKHSSGTLYLNVDDVVKLIKCLDKVSSNAGEDV
jgi:hypothetical protein